MLFCSKIDNTVEDIVGQEDLAQDAQQQETLMELVRDNLAKGQDKTRGKIKSKGQNTKLKSRGQSLEAKHKKPTEEGGKIGS